MNPHTVEEARAAKKRAMDVFKGLGTVVGVGITKIDGGYAVKVNVREQPKRSVTLPDSVGGVPVRVEVVGPIRKR